MLGTAQHKAAQRLALVSGIVILLSVAAIVLPQEASGYVVHAPIQISGNTDFIPANGVTAGAGTPVDPYVIEGWEINATLARGIEITDTDAYFIIRDVYVHSGSPDYDGVYFANVTNAQVQNSVLADNGFGIYLGYSDGVVITGNDISQSTNWGISLFMSNSVSIIGNHVYTSGLDGIYLQTSDDGAITGNNASDNGGNGIRLSSSPRALINGNTASSNDGSGIRIFSSPNASVSGNTMDINAGSAIRLATTTDATLTANTITSDGVFIEGDSLAHHNTHNITASNLVNGKPLYYYRDCNGLDFNGVLAGQLLVANCTDLRVANVTITNTDIGVRMIYVDNASLMDSDLSSNRWSGLRVDDSTGITVERSTATDSVEGVAVSASAGVAITNITFSSASRGVEITDSRDVVIAGSSVDQSVRGVQIVRGVNVTIRQSSTFGNNIGIELSDADQCRIEEVDSWGNQKGLKLSSTKNTSVVGSIFYLNSIVGIELLSSTLSQLYGNTIYENLVNATDTTATNDTNANIWDNGYPSGGNFWGEYVGVDEYAGPAQDVPGADSIGDTPHPVDSDTWDMYPQMLPGPGLPPIINLVRPVNGSYIPPGGPVEVRVADIDLSGWQYVLDGGTPVSVSAAVDRVSLDTTGWSEGLHWLNVSAWDTGGGTSDAGFEVRVDATLPVITLMSPPDGSVIPQGTPVDLEVFDDNLMSVRYALDGGLLNDLPAPYNVSTALWLDNEHNLTVYATDLAGNEAVATYVFTTDGTPPTVGASIPPDGAQNVSRSVTIILTFSEPMNRTSVEAALFLTDMGDFLPEEFEVEWRADGVRLNITPLNVLDPETTYSLLVAPNATDLAGNALGSPVERQFRTEGVGDGPTDGGNGPRADLQLLLALVLLIVILAGSMAVYSRVWGAGREREPPEEE